MHLTQGTLDKLRAERAGKRVRDHGHEVELYDSASLAPVLDVGAFHAIIVAASVHQERHQETISNFVIAHRGQLSSKPTALYPSACRQS